MTNVKPIPETGELRDKIGYWVETAYERAELTGKHQYMFFIPDKREFEISDDPERHPFENMIFIAEYDDFVSHEEGIGCDRYHVLRVYRGNCGEWLPDGEIVECHDELTAYLERKLSSPECEEMGGKAVSRTLSLSHGDQ